MSYKCEKCTQVFTKKVEFTKHKKNCKESIDDIKVNENKVAYTKCI